MITVNYNSKKSYAGKRPWADVKLQPSGAALNLKCLVDTGADYLQINRADAVSAGISLANSVQVIVSTAGGSAKLEKVSGVQVSIEGSKILTVDVLVDCADSTKPCLAGRQLLIAAFDIGFNVNEWLMS